MGAGLEKNQICEITVRDLTTEGAGVGSVDGSVVFAKGLLPGEKARVKIIKAAKRYAVARVEQMLDSSSDRREPPCDVFKRCGGCTLMHMSYQSQLEFKRRHVRDCMKRIGGVEIELPEILASEKELCYRGKAALPVRNQNGNVRIGGFAQRSHEVIDTRRCLLQPEKADKIVNALRKWMEEFKISAYDEGRHTGLVRHIVVRVTSESEAMAAVVINANRIPHETELVKALSSAGADSILINVNRQRTNVILGDETRLLSGAERLEENICGVTLKISLHTFLQVNHSQCERLYALAAEFLAPKQYETIADLYCGAGAITLYLAGMCRAIYGIEVVPQAIEDAISNAQANRITNAKFLCADCDEGFSIIAREAKLDAVVVDPPRKGLAGGVVRQIAQCGAGRIVYISCDPATLARDVKLFHEYGFEVERVQAVDMFPQTTHVECVVLMSRVEGK